MKKVWTILLMLILLLSGMTSAMAVSGNDSAAAVSSKGADPSQPGNTSDTGRLSTAKVEPILPVIKPALVLRVHVDDASRENVTYAVRLVRPVSQGPVTNAGEKTVDTATANIKVDFYTGEPDNTFPEKYIGSSVLDKNGCARLTFHQDRGKYAGGAVCIRTPWGIIHSNIAYYHVEEPLPPKPLLLLEVTVDELVPAADIVSETAPAVSARRTNVTYKARLIFPTDAALKPYPEKIAFYTGNPLLDVFPNQYLGSAAIDENGEAYLRVYQEPGDYAGGAIGAGTAWGDIYSNVVVYQVPKPNVLPKPRLVLKVLTGNNTPHTDSLHKVTYIAHLVRPTDAAPLPLPRYVDFYCDSPVGNKYPSTFLGRAPMDQSGIAKLDIRQEAGQYLGGAIWARTPWGPIRSNVIYYRVPGIIQPLPVKVQVSAGPFGPVEARIQAQVKQGAGITKRVQGR